MDTLSPTIETRFVRLQATLPDVLKIHDDILSDDERERMDRFRFPRDRIRFAICRARLREWLGERLGIAPQSVEFVVGAHGKPSLVNGELFFNVAHSGDWALFGLSSAGEIGVDIEEIRPGLATDAVARTVFSPDEWARFDSLTGDDRTRLFFELWTAKEAYVKALGLGLSHPPDSFTVRSGGAIDDPAPPDARRWQLFRPAPPDGFAAALVCERMAQVSRDAGS